jgi:pyruvate formate lyase activating enzyme
LAEASLQFKKAVDTHGRASFPYKHEIMTNLKQPLITNIEGNSQADGPGIRSVVFFKGCPLNCFWCHNPESKKIENELWWDKEKCIGCGECIKKCPEGAISQDNSFFIDRNICNLCFKCAEICPATALHRVGREMSVNEIVRKVLRYKPFFDTSSGGVTLSGGEPTLHIEFISALLKRFKEESIHTLLETAGLFDLEQFKSLILPYIDTIYFDIKLFDSLRHKHYCGVENECILHNFILLKKEALSGNFDLLPRTPLIPGITDTKENIQAIAGFYNKHQVKKTVLLSNNPAWINKLEKLGQKDQFDCKNRIRKFYDKEKKKKIQKLFSEKGIEVIFG